MPKTTISSVRLSAEDAARVERIGRYLATRQHDDELPGVSAIVRYALRVVDSMVSEQEVTHADRG